jgi:intraflagellar transport protein 80
MPPPWPPQPLAELRNAELAAFRRLPDEAEAILLQASPPLVYRALKLNVRLARWQRALDIAVQHQSHVDTVLWYRQRYLAGLGRPETLDAFKRVAAQLGPLDANAIAAKKAAEKDRERARAAAGGAASGGGRGGARPGGAGSAGGVQAIAGDGKAAADDDGFLG